jgi:hypothetical protein
MNRNMYDTDVTTFSPKGRLFQVEYAEEAVTQGSASVGLIGKDFAVLAGLKRCVGWGDMLQSGQGATPSEGRGGASAAELRRAPRVLGARPSRATPVVPVPCAVRRRIWRRFSASSSGWTSTSAWPFRDSPPTRAPSPSACSPRSRPRHAGEGAR